MILLKKRPAYQGCQNINIRFLLPLHSSNQGDTNKACKSMVPFDVKSHSYEFVLQIITHSGSKAAII